ncbi:MAG: hypothetical protein ACM30D_07510 [Hyphomicrobiales bacterium]|jgi:hypothetical protein|nr:hypothetical protein [Xanthobacteraceae bacterium]
MTDITATLHGPDHLVAAEKPRLDSPSNPLAVILFFGFLAAGGVIGVSDEMIPSYS